MRNIPTFLLPTTPVFCRLKSRGDGRWATRRYLPSIFLFFVTTCPHRHSFPPGYRSDSNQAAIPNTGVPSTAAIQIPTHGAVCRRWRALAVGDCWRAVRQLSVCRSTDHTHDVLPSTNVNTLKPRSLMESSLPLTWTRKMASIILTIFLLATTLRTCSSSCAQHCDATACPVPLDGHGSPCPLTTLTDACGCCKVCARGENETCGGPGDILGACDTNLYCHWTDMKSQIGSCRELQLVNQPVKKPAQNLTLGE